MAAPTQAGETQTVAVRTSRVGKRPVEVPAGVTITIAGGKFSAKGPKGTSERVLPGGVDVTKDGSSVVVTGKKGELCLLYTSRCV